MHTTQTTLLWEATSEAVAYCYRKSVHGCSEIGARPVRVALSGREGPQPWRGPTRRTAHRGGLPRPRLPRETIEGSRVTDAASPQRLGETRRQDGVPKGSAAS